MRTTEERYRWRTRRRKGSRGRKVRKPQNIVSYRAGQRRLGLSGRSARRRTQIKFRAEAFNVLNRVNGNPVSG